MTLQRLIYYLFGNNVVVGSHIRKQLDYLRKIVPDDFKHRDTHDLGCGDGKITIILRDIFKPSKFKGYDICPELVKRTNDKGIEAEVKDLGKGLPGGKWQSCGASCTISTIWKDVCRTLRNTTIIFSYENH